MKQFAVQVVGPDGKVRVPHVEGETEKIRDNCYHFHFNQPLLVGPGDSVAIACLDPQHTTDLGICYPMRLLGVTLPGTEAGQVQVFEEIGGRDYSEIDDSVD